MTLAFWAIKVTHNKPVEIQPPEGYVLNVTLAAIEGGINKAPVVIKSTTSDIEDEVLISLLGTLRPTVVDQISLGTVFFHSSLFFIHSTNLF